MRGALRHAPRPARGAKPTALATERQELVVAAVGAAQAQEAIRQDATLQESVELGELRRRPAHAYEAEVRLYDRLFKTAQPGQATGEFLDDINTASVRLIRAQLESSLQDATAEDRFQFERHGYFVADRVDSKPGVSVFNRTVTLKDSWAKAEK